MKTFIHIILAALLPASLAAQELQKRESYEFSWELPAYLDQLKQELTYPLAWGNSEETDFDAWRATARAKVRDCMLTPPPPAEEWNAQLVAEEQRDGYRALNIALNINGYVRSHALILVPDGEGPFPAVNLLHDHGAHLFIGKEKMIRPFAVSDTIIADADAWADNLYEGQYVGDYLASHGYVVFSADAPMWGERGRQEGVDRSKYDIIAGNFQMLGRSLCGFMTYDDIYTTEFIATLPFVDPERIGCMGCSMGAYRAWMLAAMSDRIRAAAAVCWMTVTDVQLSRDYGRKENGGFANCLPGVRAYLDYPHIASLACPKAMLFINGTQDKLFPSPGPERAFDIMHKVWQSQGADSRLQTEMWPVPHSCGKAVQERVLRFLNENL